MRRSALLLIEVLEFVHVTIKGPMNVTFVTESGKTRFTTRTDDHRVANLLSMYDECGVPSVITLSKSLGEIFDNEIGSLIETRVPLSSVKHILRVLDYRPNEILHVYGDLRSSQEERMAHYSIIGQACYASYELLDPLFTYCGIVMSTIRDACKEEDKDKILGLIHSSMVLSRTCCSICFEPEEIVWEDFLPFVQDNEELRNSVMLLAGRLSKLANIYASDFALLTPPRSDRGSAKADRFVYKRMLELLPLDIPTRDFGVEALTGQVSWPIGVPYASVYGSIQSAVQKYNVNAIAPIVRRGSFEEAEYLLGTEGISRIAEWLHYYNKETPTRLSIANERLFKEHLDSKHLRSWIPLLVALVVVPCALAVLIFKLGKIARDAL